jgi:rhamnogalacturonyl hydrolase YesR
MKHPLTALLFVASSLTLNAQAPSRPAAASPEGGMPGPAALAAAGFRRFEPAYPMQYQPMAVADIEKVLQRVCTYLDASTPARLIDTETKETITDFSKPNPRATTAPGDFMLVSYEWGVTYAGMLHAAEATGDKRYSDYVAARVKFIADVAAMFRQAPDAQLQPGQTPQQQGQRIRRMLMRSVNNPGSLDDSGAMAAAFIKASRAGIHPDTLRPYIDNYLKWISTQQFRLPDGTLARNRPLHNAVWLDDLYMSVPALSQMYVLTGDQKYLDDAARQIIQFNERMFVKEKGLYMHAWIQEMDPHPAFHWGRANGWAAVAAAELLSVMPENHPQRAKILELYKAHMRGLAGCQGINGLWHQLLDRNDTYEETSASAMFVYAIARGINRGWLDRLAYGPMASLGWNAVAKQVNDKGQVENTCVGTGMGFEPTFYQYRPVSPYAAHGYGPVFLAGAEMITLFKGKGSEALVSDGAVQFMRSPAFR